MYSLSNARETRGRGTPVNVHHRFSGQRLVPDPVALTHKRNPETRVTPIQAKSIISRNQSPDVGFNLSINPYQGCEHGCTYCFARPTHAYLDLSPGLDFETRIMAKTNAVELLEKELSARSYQCEPIAIGVNTDAYQPAEKQYEITRNLLKTCLEFRQPVALLTKSKLILRDLDVLSELASRNLVRTAVSVTTLDNDLKRRLEPRTASPSSRLKVIEELSNANIPVSVMVAPVIPRINDHEIESIVESVTLAGANTASYVLLRLPHEVAPLFENWLKTHYPQRANSVMRAIRSCRRGKAYQSGFYSRMRGEGFIAKMIARRFRLVVKRSGLDRKIPDLDTRQFRRADDKQMDLF